MTSPSFQQPELSPVTAGLGTQIYSNHVKSAVLLAGFPFLLVMMVGGFFFGLDYLEQGRYRPCAGCPLPAFDVSRALGKGVAGVEHYGLYAVGAALIWFAIAYFFHARMVRAATGSVPITRQQMPRIYNMLENLCISRGVPMPMATSGHSGTNSKCRESTSLHRRDSL